MFKRILDQKGYCQVYSNTLCHDSLKCGLQYVIVGSIPVILSREVLLDLPMTAFRQMSI